MSRYVTLRYVMWCYVTLRYVTLCCVTLSSTWSFLETHKIPVCAERNDFAFSAAISACEKGPYRVQTLFYREEWKIYCVVQNRWVYWIKN